MITREQIFKVLDDKYYFPPPDAMMILYREFRDNPEYDYNTFRKYINEWFEREKDYNRG